MLAVPDDAADEPPPAMSSVSRCTFDLSSFSLLPIAVTSDGEPVLPSILPRYLTTLAATVSSKLAHTYAVPAHVLASRPLLLLPPLRSSCVHAVHAPAPAPAPVSPGVLAVRDTLVRVARPQCRRRSGHGVFGNAHATRNVAAKHRPTRGETSGWEGRGDQTNRGGDQSKKREREKEKEGKKETSKRKENVREILEIYIVRRTHLWLQRDVPHGDV
mgnify:CR=1 FL=1